jgi:hypothetical protein
VWGCCLLLLLLWLPRLQLLHSYQTVVLVLTLLLKTLQARTLSRLLWQVV